MRRAVLMTGVLALLASAALRAEEKAFTTGDGVAFTLPVVDGLPARAESERTLFEAAGFETDTSAAPTITDRFAFVFKGGERAARVRVEDVTLPTPVLLADMAVPDDLAGAGFRRARFEFRTAPCAIARGAACSAWMFGPQDYRLYRATVTFADGETETLLQAEPYRMQAFVARLGDRIPDAPPADDAVPPRAAQGGP